MGDFLRNRRTLRYFFSIIDNIKPFYLLLIFCFLTIYIIISWIGRSNKHIKHIIFSSDDVDSGFHIWRYTIIPTIIFVFYLFTIILKSTLQKTDWLDYGRTSSLILFILFIFLFIFTCILLEMKKKNIFFNNNFRDIKNWLPLITLIIFLIITFIFFWNII